VLAVTRDGTVARAATGSGSESEEPAHTATLPVNAAAIGPAPGLSGPNPTTGSRPVICALAGGVGAARFLRGLVEVVPAHDVTAVVNTGDDTDLHGLHISPDLDTVVYTLADAINPETGWGLVDETWRVMASLEQLGGITWFRLGDRDLATHCYRTQRLSEGATLHEVTEELCRSWGVDIRVIPMSDDPVRTHLGLADGPEIAFQEYFVRLGHDVTVRTVRFAGSETARPAPGVMEAVDKADRVVVCPSNPVVSIGPILSVPGFRERLSAARDRVIGISPIIAGAALKGPADRLLRELGFESSVVGVARWYAEWMGTLVIDEADAHLAGDVEATGVRCIVAPTVMSSVERSSALARAVLDVVA
jgi:LPPG:FO 2-phospho-L-lactate transferase